VTSIILMPFVLLLSLSCADQVEPVEPGIVHTTDSGLQYEILEEGDGGPTPGLGDTVKVHYTGTLTDGTKFDSSRDRGEPATFQLFSVIQGWREGLQLMTPGSRFKFTIPSDLGYGDAGTRGIPPGATLIFDVELLEVTEGPSVPEFATVDQDRALTTDSGLVLQVLAEGEGDMAGSDDLVELEYAVWNEGGTMVGCSAMNGQPLKAKVSDMQFAFLREALVTMKPGARIRCSVPPELGFGDRGAPPLIDGSENSVWEVALVNVLEPVAVPDFVLPTSDELTKTASGLEYQVLEEGTGASPSMGQMVEVNYAGWLTDGTPFDSSYQRGSTAQFRLGQVIPGWNEGLQLMKVGGVTRFVIPPDLAYGARANGAIPANSTLVCHVELVDVK